MDEQNRYRRLVESMSEDDIRMLASEIKAASQERRQRVDMDEVTIERLRNPEFARQVREEVEAALREL